MSKELKTKYFENFIFQALEITGDDGPIPGYRLKLATVVIGIYAFFVIERLIQIRSMSSKVILPEKRSVNYSIQHLEVTSNMGRKKTKAKNRQAQLINARDYKVSLLHFMYRQMVCIEKFSY